VAHKAPVSRTRAGFTLGLIFFRSRDVCPAQDGHAARNDR
jgi:hypothetical protein